MRLAADCATQTQVTHQPFDSAACNPVAFPVELGPHLWRSVHAEVLTVHPLNHRTQLGVANGTA